MSGREGTAIAKVDWIDKTNPTAYIRYSPRTKTNGEVIVTLVPDEAITVLNNGEYPKEPEPGEPGEEPEEPEKPVNPSSDPLTYTFTENRRIHI